MLQVTTKLYVLNKFLPVRNLLISRHFLVNQLHTVDEEAEKEEEEEEKENENQNQ